MSDIKGSINSVVIGNCDTVWKAGIQFLICRIPRSRGCVVIESQALACVYSAQTKVCGYIIIVASRQNVLILTPLLSRRMASVVAVFPVPCSLLKVCLFPCV